MLGNELILVYEESGTGREKGWYLYPVTDIYIFNKMIEHRYKYNF